MPQRYFPTTTDCFITLSPGVILRGFVADVQPPLPTPLDTTTQAATYRGANRDKSIQVEVYFIRYALKPVRFEAPVPYVYPAGTHDCTKPNPVPHQTFSQERGKVGRPRRGMPDVGTYNWPRIDTVESEDCLFFVYTRPVGATAQPCSFWIHGGGWGVNSNLGPQHQGDMLSAHWGLATVAVGYRLSTFGHYPHPDFMVAGEPSVAVLDIRACLQWVHGNAAALGIDPAKIGVGGTSAGGAATYELAQDPVAKALAIGFWSDSGAGHTANLDAEFYTPRARRMERNIRVAAPMLKSDHPDYRTVQDAFDDGRSYEWVLKNAVHFADVQAFSDMGQTVTYASVKAAIAGGALVTSSRDATENVYPYQRGAYASPLDAAKDGQMTKPMIMSYAECEAFALIGDGTRAGLRNNLNAFSAGTRNSFAQRLGFADFAAFQTWFNGSLAGFGYPDGLKSLTSSLMKEAFDPGGFAEDLRVLYTYAVFGYGAWRVARAMAEEASAPAYLLINNFSGNGEYASHSSLVHLMFFQPEWNVGGNTDYPAADPPGLYADVYMDTLYAAEIVSGWWARFCATGDPNGAYSYAGFDLFAGNPPADGGSLTAPMSSYSLALPGNHNYIGKMYVGGEIDNLNAAHPTLLSQTYAKHTYAGRMGAFLLKCEENLEP